MVTAGECASEAVRTIRRRLNDAGIEDAAFEARALVKAVLNTDLLALDPKLDAEQAQQLEAFCVRREQREPLQYILGKWPFLSFELKVGPGVLIPRQDTETVVETAADMLRGIKEPRVLDLCAGSGCIGLGIKRLCPEAEVLCVEKSPEAMKYLRDNAENALQGLTVRTAQDDIFLCTGKYENPKWDMIISNPPYLTEKEMAEISPEVSAEPETALRGGEDGLRFYRCLAEGWQTALKPGGFLVLEIGWKQREAVTELLRSFGWLDIRCVKDLGGNDRCVAARRAFSSKNQ